MEQGPHNGVERDATDEQEGGGFDFEQLQELAGFARRATRRRFKLALLTFVTVASIGVLVAMAMPKTYSADIKLLAQRSSQIRILTGPNPGMDQVDNPTRNVAGTILRRDNLMALVRDTNLVERSESTRPRLLKLKDKLLGHLSSARPSLEEQELALALTLEKRVQVVTDDANVEISVEWTDPQLAYDLVTLVQKNFLEARYDNDVAMITDSIAVLQERSKVELAHVDEELAEYQKAFAEHAQKSRSAAIAASAARAAGAAPSPVPTFSIARSNGTATPSEARPDLDLASALEEKRQKIRALEDAQQRQVESLRQQLAQAQLTLTPMHPTVIALQQQLEAVGQPPPELAQLKGEERALMAQIAPPRPITPAMGLSPTATSLPFGRRSAIPSDDGGVDSTAWLPIPGSPTEKERDGPLELAESKLGLGIRAYEDALGRIDSATIELDVLRTVYKHRYTVVSPAELPKGPKKATAKLIAGGAILVAALLGVLLATLADLATGLVLETWQVRRRLKLDVIGELDRPS